MNLGKFQTCVSNSAQVLLRPNLPGRFGVFFPGPLACLPCWLKAQRLSQVCNCSPINHDPGERPGWPGSAQRATAKPGRLWVTEVSPGRRRQPLRQSVPASIPLAGNVSHPTLAFEDRLLQSQNGHPGVRDLEIQVDTRSRGRFGTRAGRPSPPCDTSGVDSVYIPFIITRCYHGVTLVA